VAKTWMIMAGVLVAVASVAVLPPGGQVGAQTEARPQKESPPAAQSTNPPAPNQKAVQKAVKEKSKSNPPSSQVKPGLTPLQKAPAGESDRDYRKALGGLPNLITSNLGGGCLPNSINLKKPDCVVEDVNPNPDGTTSVQEIPHCDRTHGPPCWRIEVKPQCRGLSPQSIGVTVVRGDTSAPIPPGATNLACATLPGR
jgi:hypothetical protein